MVEIPAAQIQVREIMRKETKQAHDDLVNAGLNAGMAGAGDKEWERLGLAIDAFEKQLLMEADFKAYSIKRARHNLSTARKYLEPRRVSVVMKYLGRASHALGLS